MAIKRKRTTSEAAEEPVEAPVSEDNVYELSAALPPAPPSPPLAPEATFASPLRVTAVLPFGDGRRWRLVRQAVQNFLAQDYTNKELVIVNGVGQELPLNEPGSSIPGVRQVMYTHEGHPPTIEKLRVYGCTMATEGWLTFWDDDDLYYPSRLSFQMAHRRANRCVLLRQALRIDIRNSFSMIEDNPSGVAASVLYPVKNDGNNYFGTVDDVLTYYGHNRIVADNAAGHPGPAHMLCVWHGGNLLSREEFFRRTNFEPVGIRPLPKETVQWITEVFRQGNLEVSSLLTQR